MNALITFVPAGMTAGYLRIFPFGFRFLSILFYFRSLIPPIMNNKVKKTAWKLGLIKSEYVLQSIGLKDV